MKTDEYEDRDLKRAIEDLVWKARPPEMREGTATPLDSTDMLREVAEAAQASYRPDLGKRSEFVGGDEE